MLEKALEELRRETMSGTEAAAASLERVRLLAALPWSRRARERTDTAAAMRELDNAHEGRHEIKERIRRFLTVRTLLQQEAWTLEGYGLDGAPNGDGADCVPATADRRARRAGGRRGAGALLRRAAESGFIMHTSPFH